METSKGSLVTRKARTSDLPEVIETNRQELPENYSPDFFKDMLEEHGDFFFVGEDRGKIVGYVMCRKETNFSPFGEYFSLSPRGHVVSLAVRSTHRRMDIGRSLMQTVHEAMKNAGIREAYLEVRTDNAPAIALYKSMGYDIRKTIRGYYMDGTDAHIMALQL
jgi:ribosomal-protein-alanine N-acetyltransferase